MKTRSFSFWIAHAVLLAACTFQPPHEIMADAEGLPDGGTPPDAAIPIDMLTAITITQNTSQTVATGHSVFCNSGTSTFRDHSWYRVFRPMDFGITNTFHISRINFTSEQSLGSAVTVHVHDYTGVVDGTTLDTSKLSQIAEITGFVTDNPNPQDLHAPLVVDIPANTTFVVELSASDTRTTGGALITSFHPGGNEAGQLARWYFKSGACGINIPVSQSGADLILSVDGTF